MRYEYTDCRGYPIFYYLISVCMMFSSVKMRIVFWYHKVRILRVVVVLGMTPLELMQFMIPPSEMVQGRVQQMLILELIMMTI